ncbi:hypothetical protein [Okeania sp. KiyG1]|uniref:hypothetical protein n=1 Tax=Okeania sp. KiyG1 TaxID=2720165 RepID=UPI0027D9FADC|nr:hypothetical protein [Okeania sp. KiyG1]
MFAVATLRERVVWNDSLACCQEKYRLGEKKPTNSELQKLFITQAKNTEDREWLSEVSNIPLQQSLNDLNRRANGRSPLQNFLNQPKVNRKADLSSLLSSKLESQGKLLGLEKVVFKLVKIKSI